MLTARRSGRGLFFQFIFPLVYVIIILAITRRLTSSGGRINPPPLSLSVPPLFRGTELDIIGTTAAVQTQMQSLLSASDSFKLYAVGQNSVPGLQHYLLTDNIASFCSVFATSLTPSSLTSTLFHNNSASHALPILLQVVANAALQNLTGTQFSIAITNAPFGYNRSTVFTSFTGIMLALFVGLAFGYMPVTYAVAVVRERENGAKHQQLVMGVRPLTFWLANFCVDFCFFLMSIALTFILFAAFNQPALIGTNGGAAFLLFFFYGFSVINFTYLVSFAFSKPQTAQSVLAMCYGFFTIILFFILTFTYERAVGMLTTKFMNSTFCCLKSPAPHHF